MGSSTGSAQAFPSATDPACSVIVAAAMIEGNWDIVLLDLARRELLNLTASPEDEQAPAFSPDGKTLAYAARRGGNWDIYSYDMARGTTRRLTTEPSYQGFPSFSPDGRRIAFESHAEGDVDVYVMPAAGGAAEAVITDRGADVEPLWAGANRLIYSTWREEDRYLASFDMAKRESTLLTQPREEPMHASVSPHGGQVAYISMGDATTRLKVRPTARGQASSAKPVRHVAWPSWSPAQRGELIGLELSGGGEYEYPSGWRLASGTSTGMQVLPDLPELPGQWQRPSCAPAKAPRPKGNWQPFAKALVAQLALAPSNRAEARPQRGATEVAGIDAPSAVFANTVVDSFSRLRATVQAELGYDYMYRFGDTWRSIANEYGGIVSWHKTGRAFDVPHAYNAGGQRRLYLARQVLGNQTYFRIYLLAKKQDGSQGAPMRESVFEVLGRQDDPVVIKEGGFPLPPPSGYFIDFTDLAEREGWTRISGLTAPDGDWRKRYNDIEYWHYERRDGLAWYKAMQLLYSDERLRQFVTPEKMRAQGYTAEEIARVGVPAK